MTAATFQIGEVADVVRGVTYQKEMSRKEPQDGYLPLLRATNIAKALNFEDLVFVPDEVVSESQLLRRGDIVLAASSGSLSVVGKAALLRSDWLGTFGAFCYVVRLRGSTVLPEYVAYFMQTSEYRKRVSELAAGVNINNLRREHIENIRIPLASLSEQQRLVEVLDSLHSRVDAAAASLEQAQTKLKAYRASVLKAAVEGQLVPTEAKLARAENRDYESGGTLLKRILAERRRKWEEVEFAKLIAAGKPPKDNNWKAKYNEPLGPRDDSLPQLPAGWSWARLEQLVNTIQQGWSPQCEKRPGNADEWCVMKTTAVQHMRFEGSENKALPADLDPEPTLELAEGDLLVTRAGPRTRVGVSCLVRTTRSRVILCDKVYRLGAAEDVSAPYLEIFLNAPQTLKTIGTLKTGISDSGVNLTQERFLDLAVPLPPRAEQDRIESAVSAIMSNCDNTDSTRDAALRRAVRLKQSILKWAFEGKLVDQDPKDEPVDKLLERIRAEDGVDAPVKKAVSRRKTKAAK